MAIEFFSLGNDGTGDNLGICESNEIVSNIKRFLRVYTKSMLLDELTKDIKNRELLPSKEEKSLMSIFY